MHSLRRILRRFSEVLVGGLQIVLRGCVLVCCSKGLLPLQESESNSRSLGRCKNSTSVFHQTEQGDEGRCVLGGKNSFLELKRVDLGVPDFEPRSYGATNQLL